MLRFCDGFDHYTSLVDLANKWTLYSMYISGNSSISGSTTTRYSVGRSMLLVASTSGQFAAAGITKKIDQQPTWTVGFAFQATGLNPSSTILQLYDSVAAVSQLSLVVNSSGTLSLYRGTGSGTLLATSLLIVNPNVWYFCEIKATINSTTGSYEVRINGVSYIAPATGANTRNSSNNWADSISIYSPTQTNLYVDDVYMLDGQGSVNTSFLGEVRIMTQMANAAGTYSQWTPSSGSNYADVNETIEDGDTSYVATSTVGNMDSYNFTDLTNSPAVAGVQVNLWARKDDVGAREIQPLVRIGGTNYLGTTQTVVTGYADYMQTYDVSPATGTTWGASEINGAEFGVNLVE